MPARWQFWIDRGGTFTDCIGVEPDSGQTLATKVLSSDEAVLIGIRELMGLDSDQAIPPCEVRLGTTLATNALLERKGARTALLVTEGFGDLLYIADQTRPELFDLEINRPDPLCERVVEVADRLDAQGSVLRLSDPNRTLRDLFALRSAGIESLAISVLHGYQNPAPEVALAELAQQAGFFDIYLGHEVAREAGYLARTETAVLDAYLTPVIRRYLTWLSEQLEGSELLVMQSSGNLVAPGQLRGKNAVVSGPAGGVVAVANLAASLGKGAAIGFDMGGTSTDACRVKSLPEPVGTTVVAGRKLRAPTLPIETVAAGGGSICRLEGDRLMVGPESAGAVPGPICYGRPEATALTLTDVGVALGRVPSDRFPFPLQEERARLALQGVADAAGLSFEATGRGFLTVAVENMATAIRRVSLARGHDPRDHAMVVFGGAGGQFACAVADVLGIRELILHPLAGVLSAYGIGHAPRGRWARRDAGLRRLRDVTPEDLAAVVADFVAETKREFPDAVSHSHAHLRYEGTATSFSVELDDPDAMRAAFEEAHRRTFGYIREGEAIEVVHVSARVAEQRVAPTPLPDEEPAAASAGLVRRFLPYRGEEVDAPYFEREQLRVGQEIEGPAIVTSATDTIIIEPGWTVRCESGGTLIGKRDAAAEHEAPTTTDRDPVSLELYANRFAAVADEMGSALRQTAISTNIRYRLDFSCAVFDGDGELVANAPHIPVHLGAMSESVKAVLAKHPEMEHGDAFVTNDPAGGGSHLPDITVVSPVFVKGDDAPTFFVASRGHHEDVGGITPGSMPPSSTRLDQEGIVLRALPLLRRGEFLETELLEALRAGPYPARNPKRIVADLRAQVAANVAGTRLLHEMVERETAARVRAYMSHVQDDAETQVRDAIELLPDGERSFYDLMDDGTKIAVALAIEGRNMRVDFTGSSPHVDGNLNAPRAVTLAAVLYVLRTLVGRALPLNSGCLRAIDLTVPERSVLDPAPDRAVAGGNVETSQRVVDVLLAATGIAAASQGTMNNLSFGNETFGYYETIGGGSGALATGPGTSGVQTHMTNTRITDAEIMERSYPIRVVQFSLRWGSAGVGQHRGGDGLIRELDFLEPCRVSVLSDRRISRAFGLEGGEPGAPGRNLIDGELMPGRFTRDVEAGSRIRIETPGGGGFGPIGSLLLPGGGGQ